MTTYLLTIEPASGRPCQTMAYSTATNAIDDLEGLQAGDMKVSAIYRDGQAIDEPTLRADEASSSVCIE